MQVVKHFRSLLAVFEVPPQIKLDGFISISQPDTEHMLTERLDELAQLSKLKSVNIAKEDTTFNKTLIKSVVSDKIKSALDPADQINFSKAQSTLSTRLEKSLRKLKIAQQKTKMPDYDIKVPEDIREREKEHISALKEEVASIKAPLEIAKEILEATKNNNVH